jgi:hypothetical protein
MAEEEIKRMNFFDGQFLKEEEFKDLDYYHLHMRRRMNYILFEDAGVISVNPDDLTFINIDTTNRSFQVKAGMAISRNDNDMEAKEIILREDWPTVKLSDEGISSAKAFVTIHYEEESVKDPPSEGDVDEPTRVKEKAVIKVHASKPTGPADNGEEYILLGALDFASVSPSPEDYADYSERQEAKIRSSLLGGVGPQIPTISGISVNSGLQGSTFDAEISGTNLDGATNVAFSGSGVTASIRPGGTSTILPITVTIASSATAGPRTFTVTTPAGEASSADVPAAAFQVTPSAPVPVVKSFIPAKQRPGYTISIRGSNIRRDGIDTGHAADGTTIRFVDPGDDSNSAAGLNPTVLADVSASAGPQVVGVTIPAQGSLPQKVTLELTLDGATATASKEFEFL